MAKKEQYILIGTLGKTHGLKGEIYFYSELWNEKTKSVFLEAQDNSKAPCKIERVKSMGEKRYVIKISEINDIDAAKKLINKKVYTVTEKKENSYDLLGFLGYQIFDSKKQKIGVVNDIIENSYQVLFSVYSEEKKEILIPFHEAIVIEISTKEKIICINIPEGLLELN
jgi:16S rRNA processing protein RimM